jgi:hypothetical protein
LLEFLKREKTLSTQEEYEDVLGKMARLKV